MKRKLMAAVVCVMLMLTIVTITATANQSPTTPTITGPDSGKKGTRYSFGVTSTDPDGDDISYCYCWGDDSSCGCTDEVSSGTEKTIRHTWDEKGTYTITVSAKDEHGAESGDATKTITITGTRSKGTLVAFDNVILRFLHKFLPRAILLRQLIENILGL
jgi:hypothetical protein